MLGVRHAVLATLPRVSRHVYRRSLHLTQYAASIQLKMPSLSPTMEEGTIVKWAKVQYKISINYILTRDCCRRKEKR